MHSIMLTKIGDKAGPKTSLCLGSRPTPKAMNIKPKVVIVSKTYLDCQQLRVIGLFKLTLRLV